MAFHSFNKSSWDPCVICVQIKEFLRGKYHNNGHTGQDAYRLIFTGVSASRTCTTERKYTYFTSQQHIDLRIKIVYLSSESTLSFRDAGFPPTRVRGFLGTTGSIGLSDSDECCFSISHFYEHSVAGCECINVYCEKTFLSVCVTSRSLVQLPVTLLLLRFYLSFISRKQPWRNPLPPQHTAIFVHLYCICRGISNGITNWVSINA